MNRSQSGSSVVAGIDISLHAGQKSILEGVNFEIKEKEIVGVVGRNGSGKSSFLKLLAGQTEPDGGQLIYKTGVIIGYLPQEFELDETRTVQETLADSLIQSIQNHHTDKLPFIADLVEKSEPWKHLIPEKHEWVFTQIQTIVDELNCPKSEATIQNLSGGEKRKVALAKILITEPDLLILDEPTNHLDIAAMEHLEHLIQKFPGAVVLVSHDRYLLDSVATRMVEIYDSKMYSHQGNYQEYLLHKDVRLEIAQSQEEKRLAFLKREIEWVRSGVKARGTKDKGRLQRFYDIKNQKPGQFEEESELLLPASQPLGNKILELEQVALKIGNKPIVQELDFSFQPQMVLGLIGNNGSGKTSLIKAILGQIPIQSGKIVIGQNTVFNYQDQEKWSLNENSTAFIEIGENHESIPFGESRISTRSYLRRFLLDNQKINTTIKNLSGGERARVLLAKILKKGGNFLILDEPTNDLDLETIRLLEESILEFQGVTIVVSHDRYFLNRVCNYILALEGDGKFRLSTGNYDEYLVKKKPQPLITEVKIKDPLKTSNKEKRALEKEIKAIEREISQMETTIEKLESAFEDPEFYQKNPKEYVKKSHQLEQNRTKLEQLLRKWEALHEKLLKEK